MLILRYLSQLSHLKNLKRSRRLQQVEPREGREKNPIEASPTEGGVDGLNDVDDSIMRVRIAVKYVRSSPARLQKFQSCAKEENIDSKALVCLNVETRWNSTYFMLKSALVFKKAFRNIKTKYLPYKKELRKVGGAHDDEDWDKVALFLHFLEIFYDTTLSFSRSRYVTSNTFVEQIYDIEYTVNRYVDDLQLNDGLRSIAHQMKLKFDKYWANVNNLNALMFISLVLDPRHKIRYVEWIIHCSYDPTNAFVLCQRIKDVLKNCLIFMLLRILCHTPPRGKSVILPESKTENGIWGKF
ncbi:hypothetical protein V6N12_049112 [Hibiscus sabdariffa]|uniref:hAT-like transposase RNase-H fold domain-containing protein n=1 Tax=Hibiscus sabdariffa TaxID=183260 RepID=A0ABR2EJ89_9ROSI